MAQNRQVTAVFERETYALRVDVVGEGTVERDIVLPAGRGYESGTVVQLTARPSSGWHFVRWGGDLEGTALSASLSMDAPRDVTAIFERDLYDLQVDVAGQGTVYQEIAGHAGKDYPSGTILRLRPNPPTAGVSPGGKGT